MSETTPKQGDPPERALLLVGAELQERRLLYAELLEAGYEVLPLPGLLYAIRAMLLGKLAPPLIVVDVYGDDYGLPEHVEALIKTAPSVPVVLVIGAIGHEAWQPLRGRVAALLQRPITIGQIVDAVRQRLPPGPIAPEPER